MGTYIVILLLLAMAGVAVYAFSKKNKQSENESLTMTKKKTNSTTTTSTKKTENSSKEPAPILTPSKATESEVIKKIPNVELPDDKIKKQPDTTDTKGSSKSSSTTKTDSSTTSKVEDPAVLAYSDRMGYDADFVKTDDFKIELNDLLKNVKTKLTTLKYPETGNKYFLKYHHFSVAMNKERNMPLLTAVNIDGGKTVENNRENDKWVLDPRLDKTHQLGGDYYKNNNLDLGHLVRRLDPVWGDVALKANEDTFHYTVCAPQHKNLNRVTWLSLEDYILKNTDIEDLKVSVFTGPVFSDRDFSYRNAFLPLQFWKMAAVIKKDGTPSVSAYILSHESFLGDMGEKALVGDSGFGEFKTYQISLEELEGLTNLNLSKLKKYDPLFGTRSLSGIAFNEIGGADSIKI